ncbi:transposase [Candidatus Clostridium helianthi]|uniref:Transposase n=1 Tax=Candidatus Clostridium helianthi TaxID=3381660 RepID=A0ABW8S343_9CLOT
MAKSKYEEFVKGKLILVEGWARNGLTNEQIAHNLGINPDTLYEYKKLYPEFSEALKKGKEIIDIEVENALLKRALGYKYIENTREVDEKTGELIITKQVEKEVQPDTTAQIFWLKNRKPSEWRDKQEIEHTGETNINMITITPEERQRRIDELKKKLNENE